MSRPRLLDLFSGAGGSARGYQLAGFHVTGVDHRPMPRYAGDVFIQADALEFCAAHGHEFDVIHASPPCQAYSVTKHLHRNKHPELIEETRAALVETRRPWVIENVVGSPLLTVIELCGVMFGLRVYRHRLFESNVMLIAPAHRRHVEPTIQRSFRSDWTGFVTVAGGQNVPVQQARDAMGIQWMTGRELSQAIPPAYCEFIGRQLIQALHP